MGGDSTSAITAEQFTTWMTPREAREILKPLDDYTAVKTIIDRLQHGLIKAVAETASITISGQQRQQHLFSVPREWWKNLAVKSTFWVSGDITLDVMIKDRDGYLHEREAAFFTVRFDPNHVRALLPRPTSPPAPSPLPPVQASSSPLGEESGKEGLPVSAALLKEWYALYQRASAAPSIPRIWRSNQLAECSPTSSFHASVFVTCAGHSGAGESQRAQKSSRELIWYLGDFHLKKLFIFNACHKTRRMARELTAEIDGEFSSAHKRSAGWDRRFWRVWRNW